jgi:hypothetical protein
VHESHIRNLRRRVKFHYVTYVDLTAQRGLPPCCNNGRRNKKPQPALPLWPGPCTLGCESGGALTLHSGQIPGGSQLERKAQQVSWPMWPERKAFVPAKATLWHSGPGGFPKLRRGRQIKTPASVGTPTGAKLANKCPPIQAERSIDVNRCEPAPRNVNSKPR